MKYYWLEAEVAGGFGDGIDFRLDRTPQVLPPMRYEFQGWLGGHVVTTSPVWIVTRQLADVLREGDFTGTSFSGDVIVSRDPQWEEFEPDVELPEWEWLTPDGIAGRDDVGIANITDLAVSERALAVIEQLGLGDGQVYSFDAYPQHPPRLDIDAMIAESKERRRTEP